MTSQLGYSGGQHHYKQRDKKVSFASKNDKCFYTNVLEPTEQKEQVYLLKFIFLFKLCTYRCKAGEGEVRQGWEFDIFKKNRSNSLPLGPNCMSKLVQYLYPGIDCLIKNQRLFQIASRSG